MLHENNNFLLYHILSEASQVVNKIALLLLRHFSEHQYTKPAKAIHSLQHNLFNLPQPSLPLLLIND